MKEKINELIALHSEAVANIPVNDEVEKAIELIHHHVHEKKGKVVVCGMGKAGHIGVNLAMTLSSTGTPSVFMHPGEAQHGDLGILQENDVLLMMSNSGKTREVLETMELAKMLYPELPIISFTGDLAGELPKHAKVNLATGKPKEICPLGLAPTTSITVMTVICNLLVVLLMEKIEFTKEAYSIRHHGGYLGKKARS